MSHATHAPTPAPQDPTASGQPLSFTDNILWIHGRFGLSMFDVAQLFDAPLKDAYDWILGREEPTFPTAAPLARQIREAIEQSFPSNRFGLIRMVWGSPFAGGSCLLDLLRSGAPSAEVVEASILLEPKFCELEERMARFPWSNPEKST